MIWVEAINIARRVAILEDGEVYPMEAFFGPGGEECEPNEATQIVCGKGDVWFNLAPADFQDQTTH